MTAPILTLAEVQALTGFPGAPFAVKMGPASWNVYDAEGYVQAAADDVKTAELFAAAPALHATCLHLHAEVARLTAERERLLAWLNKIEGGDNPSGGVEDLRQWAWKAGMGSEVDDG